MKQEERLTKKDSRSYLYLDADTNNAFIQRGECIQKLGRYEDTGLSPEEIQALQTENLKLTEQLKNAVVLPKPTIEKCGNHYEVWRSRVERFSSVITDYFDTLPEAEARLAKLEAENDRD